MRVAKLIKGLDLVGARELLSRVDRPDPTAAGLRAELALHTGDCEAALVAETRATSGLALERSDAKRGGGGASEVGQVALGCVRALSGAVVRTDSTRGIWVRFQDTRDGVLFPLVAEVAERALQGIETALGASLQPPLRIEMVTDLMTLSAITGLPEEAAETTGTVAVARYGRIAMLSPRAMEEGYPWQDTLAHEIAHLVVTRASEDNAPLWLQEGIAKREEVRWRARRFLDRSEEAHQIAKAALGSKHSIGIENLGPSVAMLPSPQAAATAYAEVADFLNYWIHHQRETGLRLLLWELGQMGPASIEQAMRSTSGYSLSTWITRWQSDLSEEVRRSRGPGLVGEESGPTDTPAEQIGPGVERRLGELLHHYGHWEAAAKQLDGIVNLHPTDAQARWKACESWAMLGRIDLAQRILGDLENLDRLEPSWLAIRGRMKRRRGESQDAQPYFDQSTALAPTLERVACQGESRLDSRSVQSGIVTFLVPPWNTLCASARAEELRGKGDNVP